MAQVNSASNSLGLTSACPSIIFHQGGTDATQGTNIQTYMAEYQSLLGSLTATVITTFGQTKPPFWFGFCMGGGELNDYDSSGTQYCPIAMSQLQLFGCAPYNGYSTPYTPNMYLMGPDYQTTDHHNAHLTGNGYRWSGGIFGKVMTRVMEYGQGWQPTHCIAVTYRGNQIIVDIHAPEPPLQIAYPYSGETPVFFTDLGFSVYDGSGINSINSVTLGDTYVVITCSRNISGNAPNASAPILKYADAAVHGGIGNICDSDAWTPSEVQTFLGNGQGQALQENLTATASLANLTQNGVTYPSYNFLCPFVAPMTAG
jgi:hypothetical protein